MGKTVSIILPCYNQGEFLTDALESILKQTYHNWEAIIVNDGSTDNTEEIALKYVAKDNRIQYFAQPNKGVSAARNNAIMNAIGEFILPLDPDVILESTYIEKCLKMFEEHKDCILAYSKTTFFGAKQGEWDLPEYDCYASLLLGNRIVCTSLFKKEDCVKIGGYDENMLIGLEDWEFYLRLLNTNKKVYPIKEALFKYRIKEISRSTECGKDDNFKKVIMYVYKKHFDKYIQYYGTHIELLQELNYYKGKYIRHYNKWYRKLWYKIFPKHSKKK